MGPWKNRPGDVEFGQGPLPYASSLTYALDMSSNVKAKVVKAVSRYGTQLPTIVLEVGDEMGGRFMRAVAYRVAAAVEQMTAEDLPEASWVVTVEFVSDTAAYVSCELANVYEADAAWVMLGKVVAAKAGML